jgi:hypothetical protein
MTDELLRKYINRSGAPGESDQDNDSDGAEDLGAFGWSRSQRDRCISLELRKKDGSIMAIGYSWIERFEFDPSDGITLHTHGKQIRIKGRNLNAEARPQMRLFQGLCRHRIPWITEADRSTQLKAGKADILIEQIEC